MPIKTFFDSRMVCDSGGYSPSGTKPQYVYEDWLKLGLITVSPFEPVSPSDLQLAHSQKYVEGVFAGTCVNGHGNRNRAVAESTLWTVGSLVAAARESLVSRVACSPSSGFHHARFDNGGGFCTFNGLMVATRILLNEGKIKKIGILDCDWHFGDGTENIVNHFQLRSQVFHRTSGSVRFSDSEHYQRWLEQSLAYFWDAEVELVLYQAGADAHRDDPLGGLLSDDEMALRDRTVFNACYNQSIPVAWNLAGGYQRSPSGDISRVIELHRATMNACFDRYCQM